MKNNTNELDNQLEIERPDVQAFFISSERIEKLLDEVYKEESSIFDFFNSSKQSRKASTKN